MPTKLKTRCRHPGCPEISSGGYCATHRQDAWRTSARRRGTPAQRGYDAAWDRVAELRRRRDGELCQHCLAHGRLTICRTVDHVVPLHVRPDWRLCLGNTQVLCAACHQLKSLADAKRYGSSAETRLNPEQIEARKEALAMTAPPRADC